MYHEFTPCAALVPFIDKFWVFKGFTDIGTRFKILADGCTDFIFSIGNMTVPTDEHSMIMQPYRSFFCRSHEVLFQSYRYDRFPTYARSSFPTLWAGSFHE